MMMMTTWDHYWYNIALGHNSLQELKKVYLILSYQQEFKCAPFLSIENVHTMKYSQWFLSQSITFVVFEEILLTLKQLTVFGQRRNTGVQNLENWNKWSGPPTRTRRHLCLYVYLGFDFGRKTPKILSINPVNMHQNHWLNLFFRFFTIKLTFTLNFILIVSSNLRKVRNNCQFLSMTKHTQVKLESCLPYPWCM